MRIEDCYEFGYITRTHGVRGELVLTLDVDDSSAYQTIDSFFILVRGNLVPYFVDEIRVQENKAVVKLEDVDSQQIAQSLIGCTVYLPLEKLPQLEDGQFYYHEVIGYQIVDAVQGRLGTIENVYEMPRQDLLVMHYQGKEVLIPITDVIVKGANHATRELAVNLPEGLLDVYLDESAGNREEMDGDEEVK